MPNARDTARALSRLGRIGAEYGPGLAAEKLALLRALEAAPLASAPAVLALHECLCFLRAYPDDARLLRRVESILKGFERRRDFRKFRARLDDTGIAGTDIYYTFFSDTARWLAGRWPDRLTVAWAYMDPSELLEKRLALLATWSETPGLDVVDLGTAGWIDRLKNRKETDAAFILRRWEALGLPPATRDVFYDEMQLLLKLAWGRGGASRTHEKLPGFPVHYQSAPLHRDRPDLWRELATPPRAVRVLDEQAGARLIDIAREAMITRSRDLDVFIHGNPRDVRLVDFDEGLTFAAIGFKPSMRLLFESVYGFLTLKNGVPIGYVLLSAINRSAEVAYNVFDTWRGKEAAHIYSRALAMTAHLFGAEAFVVPPYQLGHDNDEGLQSGAWWFYQKLGFRPRDRRVTGLMNGELGRMARSPKYRSSLDTLQDLSSVNMYLERGRPRPDILGELPLENVGLAITDYLAARFGSDRERGLAVCADEAGRRLDATDRKGWSADERLAFERWAPLVMLLPGLQSWSPAARQALVTVIRAKGGRHETDFVRAFDRHAKLRQAVVRLARRG